MAAPRCSLAKLWWGAEEAESGLGNGQDSQAGGSPNTEGPALDSPVCRSIATTPTSWNRRQYLKGMASMRLRTTSLSGTDSREGTAAMYSGEDWDFFSLPIAQMQQQNKAPRS
ncbi:hypothetical protein VTI74DRAFT_8022 [Chaetomium olivicolor]